MEREPHYLAVGLFIVTLFIAGVVFLINITGFTEQLDTQRYRIDFEGNVNGLNAGSSVYYLGVPVGRVSEIAVDPEREGVVNVIISIQRDTPITAHTVAELRPKGITGLVFVSLERDEQAETLPAGSNGLPRIRSRVSHLEQLTATLPEVMLELQSVGSRLNKMLAENREPLRTALAKLPASLDRFDAAMISLDRASLAVAGLADDNRADLNHSVQQLRGASDDLAAAMGTLRRLLEQGDLENKLRGNLDALEALLRETRGAAAAVGAAADTLKDEPSRLLYQPRDRGMEVPP